MYADFRSIGGRGSSPHNQQRLCQPSRKPQSALGDHFGQDKVLSSPNQVHLLDSNDSNQPPSIVPFSRTRTRMKSTHELSSEEQRPLLTTIQQDHLPADTRPEESPGSFSTLLRNVQCLNLVSVSVNVSTNHHEERNRDQDDGSHTTSDVTAEKERQQHLEKNGVQDTSPNSGLTGSFSTLLRNFQIFNFVSVLVNVSTNHEDERTSKSRSKDGKKKVPDYYQNIFGGEEKDENATKKEQVLPSQQIRHLSPSKIPILFCLQNSDHIEAFTVSTSATYTDIVSTITELARSSPNCKISSTEHSSSETRSIQQTSTEPLSTEATSIEPTSTKHASAASSKDGKKVIEIDIDWDIGEGRDWPKRTRLTEGNFEAVLLLMERGMVGVLDVRMGEEVVEAGEEKSEVVDERGVESKS